MKFRQGHFRSFKMIYKVSSIFLSVLLSIYLCNGQPPKNNDKKTKTQSKKLNSRWKPTLDLLFQEAKTLRPLEKSPNAMAEVADAYWDIDVQTAKDMFSEANDIALTLEKKKDRGKSFRYILNLSSRRDSGFAKNLVEKTENSGKLKGESEDASLQTANDLVDEDIIKSSEFAEKLAPAGLKYGSAMFLIFQIAKKNPELANRVYQTYLNKVLADESFPLSLSVYLIGYSFGYADYYGLNQDGTITGANLVLPKPLIVNRRSANTFLTYLYRRVAKTLQLAEQTPENQFDKVLSLFVIDYIANDIVSFSPESTESWQQLRQKALIGLNQSQIEQTASNIRSINERREAIIRRAENPENAIAEKEISSDEIEKLPDVCQRDRLYTKNAINLLSAKNYEKAQKWIEKAQGGWVVETKNGWAKK